MSLAETAPTWVRSIAPVAEHVGRVHLRAKADFPGADAELQSLPGAQTPARREVLATPLTQARRSAGRPANGGMPRAGEAPPRPPRACLQCGAPIRAGRRRLCSEACSAIYTREVNDARFIAGGPKRLAELRTQGRDTARTPAALAKMGQVQRARAEAQAAF